MVIAADGSITAAGRCDMTTNVNICMARLTAGGALDTTFSGDGRLDFGIGPGSNADQATHMTLDAAGRTVIGGICNMGATGDDMCVARVRADGTLDTAFTRSRSRQVRMQMLCMA
jgi:hypothetical protein